MTGMTTVTLPAVLRRMKASGANTPVSAEASSNGTQPIMRPPPTAAPAFKTVRRDRDSARISRGLVMAHLSLRAGGFGRGGLYRLADADVGAAAADVARHGGIDVRVGGCRIRGDKRA